LSDVPASALLLAVALLAGDEPPPAADGRGASWSVPAAHAGGLMLGMRVTLSVAWPESYDPTGVDAMRDNLRLAYTRAPELHTGASLLESDGDPWWLNGAGHALFGSEIYGRTRHCGGGPLAAFLVTSVASTVWEYGIEAPHQRPSALDLVWTPVVGGLLGEGRFRLHRWLSARRASPWLLFAVDPLGESERRLLRTRC
jgi:hypothetical protein